MTVYIKTTTQRKKQFQIQTRFEDFNGSLRVVKKALTRDASNHIKTINENYNKIKDIKVFTVIRPEHVKDIDCISFEFISSENLFSKLIDLLYLEDFNEFNNVVNKYKRDILENLSITVDLEKKYPSEIFDIEYSKNTKYLALGIVDLTFDNLFIDKDTFILLDYEWLVDQPLPLEYILFKSISGLLNYAAQLKLNIRPIIEEWEHLFNEENFKLEHQFQTYVNARVDTYDNFRKSYINLLKYEVSNGYSNLSDQTNRLDSLEEQAIELNRQIKHLEKENERINHFLSFRVENFLRKIFSKVPKK